VKRPLRGVLLASILPVGDPPQDLVLRCAPIAEGSITRLE
jgi:hypothetical protein